MTVEELAEALWQRIQRERGFTQPGNLTLHPSPEMPGDVSRRDAVERAIRGALEDDLIRFGEGRAQTELQ